MLNLEQSALCICLEAVVQRAPNFNMGWYEQVLEIFVRALKVMKMFHIITIYLKENKNYKQKTLARVEPGPGSNTFALCSMLPNVYLLYTISKHPNPICQHRKKAKRVAINLHI